MRARLFAVGSDDSFRVYFESWGDHDALCWVGSLSNEVQGPKGHTGNRRAIPTSCPERNPVPGLEIRRVGPCWSGVPGLRLQSANTPFLSTDDEIDRHARQTGGQDDPSQDLLRAYYVPATAHPLTPVISSTTHTCSGKKNVTSSNHICR